MVRTSRRSGPVGPLSVSEQRLAHRVVEHKSVTSRRLTAQTRGLSYMKLVGPRKSASDTAESSHRSHEAPNTQKSQHEDESQSARELRADHTADRRRFLQILGSSIVVAAVGCTSNNSSGNKMAKADVNYKDRPNQGQQCSGCQFYQSSNDGENAEQYSKVKGKSNPMTGVVSTLPNEYRHWGWREESTASRW